VDLAVRAHEQACLLPEGMLPGALPSQTRPPGRARVSLLSQVPSSPSLPFATLLRLSFHLSSTSLLRMPVGRQGCTMVLWCA
jgi:hypothetical protein